MLIANCVPSISSIKVTFSAEIAQSMVLFLRQPNYIASRHKRTIR
jgi:hypothetical protein